MPPPQNTAKISTVSKKHAKVAKKPKKKELEVFSQMERGLCEVKEVMKDLHEAAEAATEAAKHAPA